MEKRVKPSLGCGYAVAGVVFIGGAMLAGLAEETGARVVGAVLMLAAVIYGSLVRGLVAGSETEERRRAEFAQEPWKWRKEWLGPAIASDDHKHAWFIGAFAFVWNAISLPAAWQVFSRPRVDEEAYIVLLFPLVGAGLAAAAIYKIVQWRKFGRARFVPSSLPGVIGGYLGGVIEVPARVTVETDARVALRCIRRVTTGSGKRRHTSETVLWEREERIPADKWQARTGRTDVPVLFYIPAGQARTDLDDSRNQVIWRLTAEAATPGVDFKTTFSVPVFETGETAPPPEDHEPLLDVYRAERLGPVELRNAGIESRTDGFEFSASHLGAARAIATLLAVGLLGLLAVFAGGEVHGMIWAITTVFALIAVGAAWDLWTARHDLRVVGDEVVVRQPRGRELRVPRAGVAKVRCEPGLTIGGKRYHRLVLVGRDGVRPDTAHPGETFKARKMRRRLAKTDTSELRARMNETPEFEITFAKHVPGPAIAEEMQARVVALIRG